MNNSNQFSLLILSEFVGLITEDREKYKTLMNGCRHIVNRVLPMQAKDSQGNGLNKTVAQTITENEVLSEDMASMLLGAHLANYLINHINNKEEATNE